MDTHSFVQGSRSSSTLGQQQQEPGLLNSVLQHAIQSQLGINISQESAAIGRLGSQVLQSAAALPSQAADAEVGTGAATAPAGAAETAAAEAERHRLSNSNELDLQASAVRRARADLPSLHMNLACAVLPRHSRQTKATTACLAVAPPASAALACTDA